MCQTCLSFLNTKGQLEPERFVTKISKETAAHLSAHLKDFTQEHCAQFEASRQHIASQRPANKRRVGLGLIHARSRLGPGIPRFPGGRFSCLPPLQPQLGAAEELVDLAQSDTIQDAAEKSPRNASTKLQHERKISNHFNRSSVRPEDLEG